MASLKSLSAVLVITAALAAPQPAQAQQVGISDQQWTTLTDPLFRWLGVRTVRVIAPWDVALHGSEAFAEWMAWAEFYGLEPLVSFGRADSRLPSSAEYREALRRFRERWPRATTFSTWNEANHPGQPTATHPEAVAGFYRAAAELCPGCRVLAAEVVDIPGMQDWLRRFQAALGTRPRLWGLHNYGDVTRRRDASTRAMLAAVDGEVWLTETGGLVRFELPDGTVRWPEDEDRARASLEYALQLAAANAARIPRAYVYNWREAAGRRWDSGLIAPDGRVRPSFWALAAWLGPVAAPPITPGRAAPRATPRARVVRRPRMDRRGRVRARVRCPRGGLRCSAAMVVRTVRPPRRGRAQLGRTARTVPAGRRRWLKVRVPAERRRLIRRGVTTRVLAQLWLGGDRPARYRVKCARLR